MKKTFVLSILSASLILSCLTVPVFAEKAPAKDKKTQPVERYKKILGQKKNTVGLDYSAQSTSGVEGGAEEGLKAEKHDKKVDEYKKELFGEKPVNVIKRIIKPKKIK